MATNLSKAKKTAKQVKQEQFIKNLKKELINEIRLMSDETLLEEVNFSNFFNDKKAMKKFEQEHKEEIQLILSKIDLDPVIKRARKKLFEVRKKT